MQCHLYYQHNPYIVAEVPRIKLLHLKDRTTRIKYSCEHLLVLVCNRTVQLALGTDLMLDYLGNNIGLVLVCLPRGSTNTTASPSQYMTQPSRISILSPVLFMHVGDPTFLLVLPPFLVSFGGRNPSIHVYAIYVTVFEKMGQLTESNIFQYGR